MKETEKKKKAVKESTANKGTVREKTSKEKAAEEQGAKEQTAEEQAAKKRLAEMNLLDDFLFGTVVTYPEIGERFVRKLLRIIFGREFKHLSVTAQKVLYGADTNLHGARLDVCLEPEIEEGTGESVTVYDIEPDRNESSADQRALPRRMRFYHGKITAKSLKAGADYDRLKNVVIIMIMPYDPFGLGRMAYTIKNKCVEVPDMPYEDGASTLFLYTKGTKGAPDEALRQLLHYMEDTTYENAVNESLREMHEMVDTVKRDPEVTVRYMIGYLKEMERLNKASAKAREEGLAEGLAEGLEQGRAAGLAEGLEQGRAAGDLYRMVSLVCKKMKKQKSPEEIAEDLEEEISVIEPIYLAAKEFAPEYDPNPVFERINADIIK